MSETKLHGSNRHTTLQEPGTETAEQCIYPMPTVEEVVRAGYPSSYWDKVKSDRETFIARFNAEPEFAARARIDYARQKREHEERRKREAEDRR